jgi:hypothetical protein
MLQLKSQSLLAAVLAGTAALISTFSPQLASESQAADARVLPKGRSRLGVTFASTQGITTEFNNDGKPTSLTADYNLNLNAQTIARLYPEFNDLVQMLNGFGLRYDVNQQDQPTRGIVTNGPGTQDLPLLGDAFAAGFLGVSAEATRQQYNFTFFHGLTDRLSVGFSVPYIKTQVRTNAGLSGLTTAADIAAGLQSGQFAPFWNQIGSSAALLSNPVGLIQSELQSRGYSPFGDFQATGVGDIVLGARYHYFGKKVKPGEWYNSFQGGFTAPTGKVYSPSQITAVDFGSGVWDANLTHLTNFRLNSGILLSHSLAYTYRLPGYTPKRVRRDPSDQIPDASGEELARTYLGDKYWTNIGIDYASRLWGVPVNFSATYEWFWKNQNHFEGSLARDYSYLSKDTESYLETLSWGLGVDTIPLFFEYKFPIPSSLNFNYNIPTRGKNSLVVSYWTLEFNLYF